MQKFTKITTGFVVQNYEKNKAGEFVCSSQEFIAGDQVDYEDENGNVISPPEHKYQQFKMVTERANKCDEIFEKVKNQSRICKKLRRMAVEAKDLKVSLPTVPVKNWFDGTIQNPEIEVFFEKYDLAKLLQYIADIGLD